MKSLPLSRRTLAGRLGISLSFVGFLVSGFWVFASEIVDVDQDGLPDAWELEKFGTIFATIGTDDVDADGLDGLAGIDLVQSLLSRIPMEIRFSTAWIRHL